MKKSFYKIFIIGLLFLFSCGEELMPTPTQEHSIANGLFILNEGTFTYANSSLTFYDPEADTVENNLFYRVNMAPLGDVGNSLMIDETGMYIVVNNSRYIYKVNSENMKYKAKLGDLTSPRHIISINKNKAYVSDLGSTGLWIINPETMQKSGFIELGNTTEKMLRVDDEVIVTNWSNFYQPNTSNSTVQFVDVNTDELVGEVEVSAEPNSIVLDKNDNVWVLCGGGYMPPFEPALFCINPKTRQIMKRFDFQQGNYPSSLVIDNLKENIYFLNGGFESLDLYKMSVDDETLPTTPFINSQTHVFYNVAISPTDGDIYITDVKNYLQNGDVLRYTSEGDYVTSFEAGIVPGFMLFSNNNTN